MPPAVAIQISGTVKLGHRSLYSHMMWYNKPTVNRRKLTDQKKFGVDKKKCIIVISDTESED